MGSTIDGLVSGLNTTQIIQQLMAVERLPEQQLTQGKSDASNRASVLQSLNSLVAALRTASTAFAPDSVLTPSAWASTTASTTNSALVGAVSSSTALPGSATFTVRQVATAGAAVSSGTVALTSTPVGTGPILVSKGASSIGLSGVDYNGTLATGSHTLKVTQASAAATQTGSGILANSIVIDSSNNTFAYTINGVARSVTLAASQPTGYTPGQLAKAVQDATGGEVTAVVNGNGALTLTSAHEGSLNTLRIDTGNANAALGLTDTTTVAKGTDGVVTFEDKTYTYNDLTAGQQLALADLTGQNTVKATLGATGLRLGSATATSVAVAAGATLSDVAKAISASTAGVQATAVGVSSTAYRLQLSSTTTGAASDITLNAGAFDPAGLGSMQQLTAGTDTVLHVGSGVGAYDVTSSTGSVSGLLPGVTINALKADPTTPVTVTVTSDSGGMADKMKALVDAANAALSFIDRNSAYDVDSKTAQPLLGNSMVSDLRQRITDAVIGTSADTPAMNGVSVQRDGTIGFDRQQFLDAYAKDPAKVQTTMTAMSQGIYDLSKSASDSGTGYITAQITSEQGSVKDYTQQIADFEDRMTLRQQSLQTQYASLETMLGKLQSQSQWLAGQLSSLTTPSTSSK